VTPPASPPRFTDPKPSLAIVIPAYNSASTIERAVQSALDQAATSVVVVDDGSRDQTVEIVRTNFPSVQVVSQTNSGVCSARNLGFSVTEERHVSFLDSDDELLDGWGQAMASMLADDVSIASVGLASEDVETGALSYHKPYDLGPVFGGMKALLLPGAYSIRRDELAMIGGFDERLRYAENTDLGLRLAKSASGQQPLAASVADPLVLRHFDRSPKKVARYHRARLGAAIHLLDAHHEEISLSRSLKANLEGIAGYSAGSLGDFNQSRAYYRRAIRTDARRMKNYFRLLATCLPGIREVVW
jgi:glycosyltransferase involved in cell wall biosynthesis